jgi:integrase/recombinase XerD
MLRTSGSSDEAKRFSESSLDGVAKAIHRFESYTKFRDFRQFHIQQAVAFKADLAKQRHARTQAPLAKATLLSTLNALKAFFQWLAGQPGYKSRLKYSDAEYFNLSEKEVRVAKARREQRVPTLEQILRVLAMMPAASEIEQRNRALIALYTAYGCPRWCNRLSQAQTHQYVGRKAQSGCSGGQCQVQ